jgi:hypothetical protein
MTVSLTHHPPPVTLYGQRFDAGFPSTYRADKATRIVDRENGTVVHQHPDIIDNTIFLIPRISEQTFHITRESGPRVATCAGAFPLKL